MGDDRDPRRRVRQIQAFREECEALAREGVFEPSAEQRAAIDTHHARLIRAFTHDDIDLTEHERSLGFGIRLTILVGIVALAAAVLLGLRRAWGWLDAPAQVSVALLLPALTFLATHYLASQRRHVIGRAMPLLAFVAVVANIEILGAALSFPPSPYALLVYGVAGLGLAYAYDSRVTLVAGALCVAGFAMALPVMLSGAWWVEALRRPETAILVGMAYLAVSTLPSGARFAPWWRGVGLSLIAFAVLILGQAGGLTWVPSADARAMEVGYTLTTLALGVTMIVVGARNDWAGVGVGGAALLLVAMTLQYFHWGRAYLPQWVFFALVAAVALGAGWMLRRTRRAGRATA